jgi:hypothetical protein
MHRTRSLISLLVESHLETAAAYLGRVAKFERELLNE